MSAEEIFSPIRGRMTLSMLLMHSMSGPGPGAMPPKVRMGDPMGRIAL
jgi:hypothetical protein